MFSSLIQSLIISRPRYDRSRSKASSFHVFCGFVGVDPVARERVSLLRKVARGPHEGIANTVLNKQRITIDRRESQVFLSTLLHYS